MIRLEDFYPVCASCREEPGEIVLHCAGQLAELLCIACADSVMYLLSLTVPEDEGRAGYASWRAEVGLDVPTRWPERERV